MESLEEKISDGELSRWIPVIGLLYKNKYDSNHSLNSDLWEAYQIISIPITLSGCLYSFIKFGEFILTNPGHISP
ncbi:MAG TPA: hypothetical protein VJB94_02775 [Candidatus Nanoarchaeia archaeon]|nr:hypothetical protein [Candidatus Nanoarchaeia archaeon]